MKTADEAGADADKVPASITRGRVCIAGGGCRAEHAV